MFMANEPLISMLYRDELAKLVDFLPALNVGDSYCGFATASVGSCC